MLTESEPSSTASYLHHNTRKPRVLWGLTEAVERGSLSVNVRLLADVCDELLVSTLVSRAILAFLGATIGLMSLVLLGVHEGPRSAWSYVTRTSFPESLEVKE